MDSQAKFIARLAIVCVVVAAAAATGYAHNPGLSSANLEIANGALNLQLTFNERDIAGSLGSSEDELRSSFGKQKLEQALKRAVVLIVEGVAQTPSATKVFLDENKNVEFRYAFPQPNPGGQLLFDSVLLKELPFGHRQVFSARDGHGKELARQILSARESVATFTFAQGETQTRSGGRFLEFFSLGIRHILTGYDHLLFLCGLLIVCRTPRSALLLITCFTVAHSLTLALSTFGLVHLPSRFVEATIAASILYVGTENLIRRDANLRWRWLLTFAFGLIHGLGFASVLHEMGIAKTGSAAVVPLIAFNSGVEAGQLGVAAVVLPIIWQLRKRPAFVRVGVPACSVAIAAAGAFWLLERTVLS